MAIFSKKENTDEVVVDAPVVDQPTPSKDTAVTADSESPKAMVDVVHSGIGTKGLIVPRISEKAGFVARFNQYIFTIHGKLNKIEVKNAVQKMYGVKIANINMIQVAGKGRRFGNKKGMRSGFKKAVITLTPDSKKIDIVEPN